MCGVSTTLGSLRKGCSAQGGSGRVTSMHAMKRPVSSSFASASSSISRPRAVLTSSAPSFISGMLRALSICSQSGFAGACSVSTSLVAISSSSSICSTPSISASSGDRYGSHTRRWHLNGRSILITSLPTLEAPTMPTSSSSRRLVVKEPLSPPFHSPLAVMSLKPQSCLSEVSISASVVCATSSAITGALLEMCLPLVQKPGPTRLRTAPAACITNLSSGNPASISSVSVGVRQQVMQACAPGRVASINSGVIFSGSSSMGLVSANECRNSRSPLRNMSAARLLSTSIATLNLLLMCIPSFTAHNGAARARFVCGASRGNKCYLVAMYS